jgi:catechol 2,3-dioxygenase-like lactoylglutathione lyase family enzyme
VITESFPILSVADLDRSLAFYRDLLGGTVDYAFPPEGEPQFVTLRLGDSALGLGATAGGVGGDSIHAGAGYTLCAYVADCDAAVEALRAAGHAIREEPSDQPWGERIARAGDPDGYEVLLVARL